MECSRQTFRFFAILIILAVLVSLVVRDYFIEGLEGGTGMTGMSVVDEIENEEQEKLKLKTEVAKKVAEYFTEDTKYKDYLNFLTNSGNMSMNLVSVSVFEEFIAKKKTNSLTVDFILSQMTDF